MELDFTAKGYWIMAAIWAGAGCMGGLLAMRQKRRVLLWTLLCTAAPLALFFLAGDYARHEAAARDAAKKDAGTNGTAADGTASGLASTSADATSKGMPHASATPEKTHEAMPETGGAHSRT